MIILFIILLGLLSGLFYRLGGWGQPGRDKFPKLPGWLFDTKARDVGCALVRLGAIFLVGNPIAHSPWWIHLISFLLLFGALTTYWDFLFGFDNYWVHGFVIGLSALPYAIYNSAWIGFGIQCVGLAVLMGAWSLVIKKDWLEEGGRGFIIPFTALLL